MTGLPDIDPIQEEVEETSTPTSTPQPKKVLASDIEDIVDRLIKILVKLPDAKELAKEIVYTIMVNTLTPEEINFHCDTIKFNIHLGDDDEEEAKETE